MRGRRGISTCHTLPRLSGTNAGGGIGKARVICYFQLLARHIGPGWEQLKSKGAEHRALLQLHSQLLTSWGRQVGLQRCEQVLLIGWRWVGLIYRSHLGNRPGRIHRLLGDRAQ